MKDDNETELFYPDYWLCNYYRLPPSKFRENKPPRRPPGIVASYKDSNGQAIAGAQIDWVVWNQQAGGQAYFKLNSTLTDKDGRTSNDLAAISLNTSTLNEAFIGVSAAGTQVSKGGEYICSFRGFDT